MQNRSSAKQKLSSHANQFFRKQAVYYFDDENRRHFEDVVEKDNFKRVHSATKSKQRESQQKNFLLYENFQRKLFQHESFYISQKKSEVTEKTISDQFLITNLFMI